MKLIFDCKTDQEIVFRGHVVMSCSESGYLRCLIEQLRGRGIQSVLEVGYGLGISAAFMQELLQPTTHHIVEIEDALFSDCARFCRAHDGARALHGDYYDYVYPQTYDLLFFDPYDYQLALNRVTAEQSYIREFNREVATAHKVLDDGGFLCHTFFGDCPPPELAGFVLHDGGLFRGLPIITGSGVSCTEARLGYYEKIS